MHEPEAQERPEHPLSPFLSVFLLSHLVLGPVSYISYYTVSIKRLILLVVTVVP